MSARLSLWLLPPKASAASIKLSKVIQRKVPSLFPDEVIPVFVSHIALATGITSSFFEPKDPQVWLDALDLDTVRADAVLVVFTDVLASENFTKKCYLEVRKTVGLEALKRGIQQLVFKSDKEEAIQAVEEWDPHLSLLYWGGDLSEKQLALIQDIVDEAGIATFGGRVSWTGGRIQLVDTSKPVEQWEVLAERLL